METCPMVPLEFERRTEEEMRAAATEHYTHIRARRSVRDFSAEAVPHDVIEACLRSAGTAPSGANLQPWHFVAVERPDVKRQIRAAAQSAEQKFYAGRAPPA